MKLLMKILCMFAVFFAAHFAYAQNSYEGPPEEPGHDTFATKFPVSVILSAGVQQKLSALSSKDRKRMEKAMKTGSAFMQQYLDGYVCFFAQLTDDGLFQLVGDPSGALSNCGKTSELSESGNTYQLLREMCSRASLNDFRFENDVVSLTYDMTVLGATKRAQDDDPYAFTSEDTGREELIVVAISATNKVSSFAPEDMKSERMYQVTIFNMRDLSVRTAANWPAYLKDQAARHKKIAEQMQRQAAKICKRN